METNLVGPSQATENSQTENPAAKNPAGSDHAGPARGANLRTDQKVDLRTGKAGAVGPIGMAGLIRKVGPVRIVTARRDLG